MDFFNQAVTRAISTTLMDFFSRFSIEKFQTITVSGDYVFAQRKVIPVPVQWATREKWVEIVRSSSSRKAMDPSIRDKNPIEMQWILPRISCNLTGVLYDPTRRLTKTQQVLTTSSTDTTRSATYTPSPYNLTYEIATISRYIDENLQLMEQILPYFSPTLSLTLNLYPDKEPESIPIVLESITMDNPTDIPEFEERIFTNIYTFTVKLNYYMPTKVQNLIDNINTNLVVGNEVVQINKQWISSIQSIQTRFNQYTNNSTLVNPFLIDTSYKPSSIVRDQNPSVELVQDNGTITLALSYNASASQEYINAFKIWYRLDDDIYVYEYTEPITINFNKISYWADVKGVNTNTEMEVYEYIIL